MKTTPTIWQRLTGETPLFWRKVQIVGLLLIALAGHLAGIPAISQTVLIYVTGAGIGLAIVAQFAVTDTALLKDIQENPSDILTDIPKLIDQVAQVHTMVTSITSAKTVADIKPTVDQVNSQVEPIKIPPANTGAVQQ